MIAGILLAAGEARRFGANKLVHPVDGRPMISHTLTATLSSRLDLVHVVVGHEAERVRPIVAAAQRPSNRINIIMNYDYQAGLMSSLKCGLRALGPNSRAAVVLLADMPYISGETIDKLISAFETREALVVATSDGTPTHPRLIPRSHFDRFMALRNDEKGQAVFEAEGFVEVPVSGTSGRDIDRPRDIV